MHGRARYQPREPSSKVLALSTLMKLDQKIVQKLICMLSYFSKAHQLNKDEILHSVQLPFVETLLGI